MIIPYVVFCVSATAQYKLTTNYHGTTEEPRSVPAVVAAKFLKKPCLREAFSRRDLKCLLLPNKVGGEGNIFQDSL